MINLQHLSQISISGIPVIQLNLPNGGGIFANGLLSLVGTILSVVFSLLLLIWVVYSMYAAYKIIRSQGESKGIEEGVGIIKNIWITISVMIVFFVILGFLGSLFGFGSVYDWSQNLAQCGPNGPFYFQQVTNQRSSSEFYAEDQNITLSGKATVYCCTNVPLDFDLAAVPGYHISKTNSYIYVPDEIASRLAGPNPGSSITFGLGCTVIKNI